MNFKEALIAHLHGDKVEVKSASETHHGMPSAVEGWRVFAAYYYGLPMEELAYLASLPSNSKSFRLAPRTITVNGVEVPAPESESMADGCLYFVAAPHVDLWAFSSSWSGSGADNEWLQRGLIYINQDDAIARAKAMLLFSK